MILRRTNSSRPPRPPPSPRQQVLAIARFCKIDDAQMLEAVLGGMQESEIITQGKRSTPRHVVDDAYAVCIKAWDFVRRVDPGRKAVLRGCSRELLVLAAHQAVLLDDLLKRVEVEAKEQADAQQRRRQQLQNAFERAGKLRDQARRLFGKILGTNPTAKAQAREAALAEEQGGSVVEALDQLARFAERLLADPDPHRQRCNALYGLDAEYIHMLTSASQELRRSEDEFEAMSQSGSSSTPIHWCTGVNLVLLTQIIEAFLGANELDSTVPFLRPAHHEHLVRRISRLPPPPLPRALAPRVQGLPVSRAAPPSATATRHYIAAPAATRIQYQNDAELRERPPAGPGMPFQGRLGGRSR